MVAMFDANPDLRGVSSAHTSEVTRLAEPALLAEMGLAPGDPMVAIISAAIGAVIPQYVETTLRAGTAPDLHQSFMRYLRAIITAAQPT
jgi:hypothetical protein